MAGYPKLKVMQPSWDVTEEIRDIEQGKYLPFCSHIRIVVEGEVVTSYEELLNLAAESRHKDKDFLEVRFFEVISGG